MQQLTVALVVNRSDRGCEATEPVGGSCAAGAIAAALETLGARVLTFPWSGHGSELHQSLARCRQDIHVVFNGLTGQASREAVVPGLLEDMQIPYTGTSSRAMSAAVEKHVTRRKLAGLCVRQPAYQQFQDSRERLRPDLAFPLIAKPAKEGGSQGITAGCVVSGRCELESVVGHLLDTYGSPVLVETYLQGREYTVGIVGDLVLPPLEFDLALIPGAPVVRDPLVKEVDIDYARITSAGNPVYRDLMQQARTAHTALDLGDYSRVDFRANRAGVAYFLEVNPLPGLDPRLSDLPVEARAVGLSYVELIALIVASALRRYRAPGACPLDSRVGLELEAVAREASRRVGMTTRDRSPARASQHASPMVQ